MAHIARLGETPFAVVAVETTGLFAKRADRILEIAVLRVDATGRTLDEYATLVDPQRDVGPTSIHGIAASDVVSAPRFDEIAGDVAQRLSDAILVAHNIRFDLGFLTAEFARVGVAFPAMPMLCTLDLAYRLCAGKASRKLGYLCRDVGLPHDKRHNALADARTTATLIALYVESAARIGLRDLPALGCDRCEIPERWHSLAALGRRLCRAESVARQAADRTYLSRLVGRLPGNEATNAPTAEYLALLDLAIEDRIVARDEAEGLMASAMEWGMSRADVEAAHRAYLASLATGARADGSVTGAERHDLEAVCEMLGLERSALEQHLAGPSSPASPTAAAIREDLSGKSVCFTGELLGRLHGRPIMRDDAERIATQAGLVVKKDVTKQLDILVCTDALTQSSKARKARGYGIRIMAEPAFWHAIGVSVE
jgi:DNA polymerase-3 subunit epsilon